MTFKSILDPEFKYRNAVSTDLRKTFERIRREQQPARELPAAKTAAKPAMRVASSR